MILKLALEQEFFLDDANVWYIRFSMDLHYKMMACGSRFGRLFVWDLTAKSSTAGRPKTILKVPLKDKNTVSFKSSFHPSALD